MRVAIQGEAGSFSDEAVATFVPDAEVVACASSLDVFDALDAGRVDAALVPVENSLAGPVVVHLDLLLARRAFVEREHRLRIRHALVAAPGTREADVTRVLSHPIALEQCRDFFRARPHVRAEPFYDTAGAAAHVVRERLRDAAAIASRRAALVHGGRVLRAGLEDDRKNFTRFFLVRRADGATPLPIAGADKTSVAFVLHDQPGALWKALAVFALRDVNLTQIESRPLRGRPWQYVFFADFLRGDDEPARKALAHLAELSEFVKVLGVYPRAAPQGASRTPTRRVRKRAGDASAQPGRRGRTNAPPRRPR